MDNHSLFKSLGDLLIISKFFLNNPKSHGLFLNLCLKTERESKLT